MTNFNDTLLVFTTSPTGLGHIRVMNAIKDGKPAGVESFELGITNIRASMIHELGSRVLPFIKLTEFYQTNPLAEAIVTAAYTRFLRRHIKDVVNSLTEIKNNFPNQKKWVIVSTHFALAHSIAAGKSDLEKKLGVKIYLCVIVTDDSPQRVWVVPGSDLTFVPSEETKAKLERYFPKEKRNSVKVISYPISPRLTQNLSTQEFQFVINQLIPSQKNPTQIEVPISGAAVQLPYFNKLMSILCRENFEFTVTGQDSMLTKPFFNEIRLLPRVQTSVGLDPWQTVKFYESLFYQTRRPAVEITKPSEQAFKAILTPRQRGGVILLLTEPIGRQEYDNLQFLLRNKLIPTDKEQEELYNETVFAKWMARAMNWRAIRIPRDPNKAASFIKGLKTGGVLYAMLSCTLADKPWLTPNGVAMIWDNIGRLIA